MTDKMFDEKGLRAARNENDPEKQARSEDEAADVEGHVRSAGRSDEAGRAMFGPEEASEAGRMAARDEDESPDVEGHIRAMEPEKTREPGRMAARDEDEDPDVEGHRLVSYEAEKTREPGRMAARDEDDDDDGEGEGMRSA
jgi:hypothetical protein